jgi:large subunit ribosomal protein L25
MQQTVVKATLGRQTGSRSSRRLRAEGKLPGVIYGLGKDPQPVAVDYAELRGALNNSAGMNTVFTLEIDGSSETVLVYDVQRDPIKRVVTHADFLRIDPEQKVRVNVPIVLVGDGTAVTEAGGLIEQQMFELELEVRPDAIPDIIEADISIMTLDHRLAVSDLALPSGSTSMVDERISVAAAVVPRSAKVAEADALEDGEEIAEGGAETAEGGDADQSGDDGE